MELILCWIVGPIGLLGVAAGLSLLTETISGIRLPWSLRPALGLAAAIVLARIGISTAATADLTVPAIIVLAAAGWIIARRGLKRPAGAILVVAGVVLFVYAAPFLVSGRATWAGYIKLDDTATWMALTDHIFEFGTKTEALEPSTHSSVVSAYLGTPYPTGSFAPPALMSGLVGQDIAWTFQPAMAVAAVALALTVMELVKPLVSSQWGRAGVAMGSALSAMLLGYYLWGGIKEIYAAALLPLGPALFAVLLPRNQLRSLWIPLAIWAIALVAVLGPGGAGWVGPILVPLLFLIVYRSGALAGVRVALPAIGLAVAPFVLFFLFLGTSGLPPLLTPDLTSDEELGNLTGPLSLLHLTGVWPAEDFRSQPSLEPLVVGVQIACFLLAVGTVAVSALSARRGNDTGIPLLSYTSGGLVGALVIIQFGSPWVDGKAMTIVSPALLAAALVGVGLILERSQFRWEGTALAVATGGVIAWGAFLAYQGAWLAPQEHYREQQRIAERFDGAGPTLVVEVSTYGHRHFFRKLASEGATDLRFRPVQLTWGRTSTDDQYVDTDDIEATEFSPYSTVIGRRGPATSRPGPAFELAYAGTYYEVWRRGPAQPGRLVEHLPLGNTLDSGGLAACGQVRSLGEAAGPGGTLVAGVVGMPVALDLANASRPESWSSPTRQVVRPDGEGTAAAPIVLPTDAEYEVWVAGAVHSELEIRVDGEEIASQRGVLNYEGGYEPLARVQLAAGRHLVELDYAGPDLHPGSGSDPYAIGPVVFDDTTRGDPGLEEVPAARSADLCNRRWDWIEAYACESSCQVPVRKTTNEET